MRGFLEEGLALPPLLCEDFDAEFNRLVALGKTQGLTNGDGAPDPAPPACRAPHGHGEGHGRERGGDGDDD